MKETSWAVRVNNIKNTSDIILNGLMEMIYDGEFKPGQKLIQEEIANIFKVSRVSVRDAFQKLIEVGLAEKVPRKGLIVEKLSQKRTLELYQTREILESAAISLVTKNITPIELTNLEEINEQQKKAYKDRDTKKAILFDDKFHKFIFSFSILKNKVLANTINSIRLRIKHPRDVSRSLSNNPKWILDSTKRHSEIIQAIKSRNIKEAKKVIVTVINKSKKEQIHFIKNYK